MAWARVSRLLGSATAKLASGFCSLPVQNCGKGEKPCSDNSLFLHCCDMVFQLMEF